MLLTEPIRCVFTERHDSIPSRKDGMSYGSHVENESQKIIMKCFGSCQLFRGLWVDLSSEFADIHMRIDAKNLVSDSINHSLT